MQIKIYCKIIMSLLSLLNILMHPCWIKILISLKKSDFNSQNSSVVCTNTQFWALYRYLWLNLLAMENIYFEQMNPMV